MLLFSVFLLLLFLLLLLLLPLSLTTGQTKQKSDRLLNFPPVYADLNRKKIPKKNKTKKIAEKNIKKQKIAGHREPCFQTVPHSCCWKKLLSTQLASAVADGLFGLHGSER